MTPKPKVLLFDLGGVIVPWVGMEALAAYNNITRAEVSDRFDASEVFRAFERGQTSEADFVAVLPRMFDLPDTDISALWNSWVHAPYPGTLKALASLKTRFTTACLSNTNPLHWAHLNTMFNTDETFHHAFASHEIFEAKPDAESYLKPIKLMNCALEDVWFFDDTEANVEGARAVGLTTFHVDRSVGVMPVLRELGLLN
ncbi:MAG: HAD family phosphatase [Litorimonas sp.]